MTRLLLIIISALLVTSIVEATPANVIATRKLFRRDGAIQDQCSSLTWDREVLRKFNGIFFGNFTAGGFRGTAGPLAVQGNFNAPNYNINTWLNVDCNATNSFDSYGFVLGGNTNSFNTQVYGAVYIGGKNSSLEEIFELATGCIVTENQGTGLFDFDTVRLNRELASLDLYSLTPTQKLDTDGKITGIQGDENPNYEVFFFNTCENGSCGSFPQYASDPNSIFFGQGEWKGLQDSTLDTNKTIVLNIPVTNGANITLTTDNPSTGFYTCKLIYNFYPVDDYGHIVGNGTFNLIRNTKGSVGGYILAPRAKIFDGATGYFAGNVVGKEYAWTAYAKEDGDIVGSPIYWYEGPSNCTEFTGCVPIHNPIPAPIYIPLPEPSTSRVRTQTFAVTREIKTTRIVRQLDYITRTVESFPSTRTTSSYHPTTVISEGSLKRFIVPGSTVIVDLGNERATTVVVEDKTVEVVPDIRVITKVGPLVTRTTVDEIGNTLTTVVTEPVPEACTQTPGPDYWHPHRHGSDWYHGWYHDWYHDDYDYDMWHRYEIDHSEHHHEPDKECDEFDDSDTQYKKE